jgi:hypothetical protein
MNDERFYGLADTVVDRAVADRAAAEDVDADTRLDRIIGQIVAHFPAFAPAIIAVSRHVIAAVDGVADPDGLSTCRCLPEPSVPAVPDWLTANPERAAVLERLARGLPQVSPKDRRLYDEMLSGLADVIEGMGNPNQSTD